MAGSTVETTRSAVSRRVLIGGLWLGVVVVTVALVTRRYIDATAATGLDLESFYLPAARMVAKGGSPYDTEGYVYTPLIAVILAPIADAPWVAQAWKGLLLTAAVVACVLGAVASTPSGWDIRRPLVLGVAIVSVLYSWPLAHDLWYGQPNVLVLLAMTSAMVAHTRNRARSAGFALGVAAVVKTWPGGLLLWLFRSPVHLRSQQWQGVGLAALLGLALTLAVGGHAALRDLVRATFQYSNQELVAYSAWGAGDYFFTQEAHAMPIVVSPLLDGLVSWSLAMALIGLALVVLRHPGDPVVALPNLMFLIILLLPVAHAEYMVLALPTLWWWTARTLRYPRSICSWLPTAVLAIWWVVTMRVVRTTVDGSAAQLLYALTLAVTLAAVTTSIVCAGRIENRRLPPGPK